MPSLLLARGSNHFDEENGTTTTSTATPTPTVTPHGRRVGFSAPVSRQSEVPSTPLNFPAPPNSAPLDKRDRERKHRQRREQGQSVGRFHHTERALFGTEESGFLTSPHKRSVRRHKTWTASTEDFTPGAASSRGPESPKTISGPPTGTHSMSLVGGHFGWTRGASIGSGSHGSVFKALDRRTGRIFAVKKAVVDEGCEDDRRYRDRLEEELEICKDLRHPNIVACLGFESTHSQFYIYLEYVPGGSMSSLLAEFGPLESPLLAQATCGLVMGLDYLHSRNPPVVHRDIKGANILVDLNFCVKLADFGCSKRNDVTKSFTTIGSIPWMAPEVMLQQEGHGRKADVWSLGCAILEMATAEKPWGNNAFENVMFALRHIAMSEATPQIPEALDGFGRDFVGSCVQRNPEDRPSAWELLRHHFLTALH